jgi:hypothetical protein
VAEQQIVLVEAVWKIPQPPQMYRAKHFTMAFDSDTGGWVEAVGVHTTTAGGIVIAQDDDISEFTHQLAAFVRIRPVSDNIPKTDIAIDVGRFIRFDDSL